MKQNYGGIWRDLDAECAAWNAKQDQISLAADWHRQNNVAMVCSRFELEPDEFYTAEQKAAAIINQSR